MPVTESRIRLFVGVPLRSGETLRLVGMQGHYLANVMRVRTGHGVALFNGVDGEWQARVATVTRDACTVVVEQLLRPQRAEPGPWLAFAPLKKTRTQFLVEKATELGVSRLLPVLTERTVTERVNVQRLSAHAVEAAEQCRRLTLPDVMAPVPLGDLVAGWPGDRQMLVMDCGARGPSLLGVLAAARGSPDGRRRPPPAFLVGPEGGLSGAEIDRLRTVPFVSLVALGERILRAETAALSVLACWQAVDDDRGWRSNRVWTTPKR
ncbi:MAG: 16S rRNA (uracil(1498)-N(3))-methyltransferase [Rhodospirillales bacterium]